MGQIIKKKNGIAIPLSASLLIVDTLDSTAANAALSANQGRILKNLIGDETELPDPSATICKNVSEINTNLGDFSFYKIGSIDLVANVSDESFYTDEDGYYILANSITGQEMIDDVTYKALANTERIYSWGADSASPFNGGGGELIPKELLSYTISTTGSTSCSSYRSDGSGDHDYGSFSCESSNIFTTKTPDGKKAFLYKISTGIYANSRNGTARGWSNANAHYYVKDSEGQTMITRDVSSNAGSGDNTQNVSYTTPIDLIENFIESPYIKITSNGGTDATGGYPAGSGGVASSQAGLNTITAYYIIFK